MHDQGEMPFLDHLEELRWRIIYALGALVICVALGFFLSIRFDLVAVLARPVLPLVPQHSLYFTHPSDKFSIEMNISIVAGMVLASPAVLYQAWLFLAPALRPHEKRIGLGVLFGGLVLFVSGVVLAFTVVMPLALPWLFDFGSASLTPLITADEYFSFLSGMTLTFGLGFELPMVVLALAALGFVTPELLSRWRRHAIVAIIIAGAFLTPGDMVWTTIALAVPLYLLYELSVAGAKLIYRSRRQRALP